MIVKLVSPHASLIGQTAIILAIFAVAALPAFILAAFTIDSIGRKLLQWIGFGVMAVAFACMWLVPGATTTLLPFLLLFGATENRFPASAVALGVAESRDTRPPSA